MIRPEFLLDAVIQLATLPHAGAQKTSETRSGDIPMTFLVYMTLVVLEERVLLFTVDIRL